MKYPMIPQANMMYRSSTLFLSPKAPMTHRTMMAAEKTE